MSQVTAQKVGKVLRAAGFEKSKGYLMGYEVKKSLVDDDTVEVYHVSGRQTPRSEPTEAHLARYAEALKVAGVESEVKAYGYGVLASTKLVIKID